MKNKKNINPFVLIFCVVVIAWLFTFIITPGTLEEGVYTPLPRNTFSFNNIFNLFRAIPMGLKDTSNLVILILVIGAALEIYRRTGAIDSGIHVMVQKFGQTSATLLLVVMILVFSAMGGFLGWIEVLIPFCPLVVAVVLALGYDSIVAVSVVIIGSMAGFMAGPTNLYTVGVCNGILQKMGILEEGTSVFVGLPFRLILWIILTVISIAYILFYAERVKKDPSRSLMKEVDVSDLILEHNDNVTFTGRHILVLLSILVAMVMTIFGMQKGYDGVKWTIDDVSAIFLASALFSGFVGKMKPSEIADAFLAGAKGAIGGAMIVGFARAVYWIMNTAGINATIVYNATQVLKGMNPIGAAIGIVLLVSLLNGLIPSGSGKGALLSPIIIPIAMELGLASQTSVLAYQFGDGITNMFWFSYGTLMIFLGYGKVSIQKWWKFFVPLMLIFFVLAAGALIVAIHTGF